MPGLRPGPGVVAAAYEAVRLLGHLKVAAHDREIAEREPRLVESPHRPLGTTVVGINRHDAGNDRISAWLMRVSSSSQNIG